MASTSICTSCLRALRAQSRRELQPSILSTRSNTNGIYRSISTSQTRPQETRPPKLPQIKVPSSSTSSDPIKSFAASVRQSETFRSTTEPYVAYGTTETLFAECSRQISYTVPSRLKEPPEPPPRTAAGEDLGEGEGWWYRSKADGGLALDVTFNTWAQVVYLHMYMLTVRLRAFPAQHAKIWHQQLLDHFFYAAEDRMVIHHNLSSRGQRNKYLKDLWQQWRGILLSYDEGLIKGDAVLAAAIWRNVFKADVNCDIEGLALVTAYMRQQLKMLDELSDTAITEGKVKFGDPGQLKGLVGKESAWMRKNVTPEELKAAQEKTT